jgi:hypothetical protein
VVQIAAAALALFLVAVGVWSSGPRPADFCADGDLQLVGSSADLNFVHYLRTNPTALLRMREEG